MKGDQTWEEYMAENLRDPEYAREHAIGRPFHNLGLNVWSFREARGMTQQQLAGAARTKQPRIAEIERDETNPTLMTISRIAVALGVTASELLAEPDEARLARAREASERVHAAAKAARKAEKRKRAASSGASASAPASAPRKAPPAPPSAGRKKTAKQKARA